MFEGSEYSKRRKIGRAITDEGGKRLFAAAGVVGAPVDTVTELLVHQWQPGPNVLVDRARRRFVTQGGWWFRSVMTLSAHEDGTRVDYEIFDISLRWRFMVPLVLWQYRRQGWLAGILDIEPVLRGLGERLGVATRRLGA
jgi:hypothetical protein